MWSEAIYHTAARLASAACSFLLFALIARYCSPEDAKSVFFFSFALGFLIVTLRTFGTLAAGLRGHWGKVDKLRSVIRVTGQLLILQVFAALGGAFLFRRHPVPLALLLATCLTVILASFDSDLLRASLNRRSSFSVAFAVGGGLAVLFFLASPGKTIATGSAALLLQWLPVVCVNVYLYGRVLRRKGRVRAIVGRARWGSLAGSVLIATFDGFVLNAPFLLGTRIGPAVGMDLSVSTRLFVSSLPLFPLVMHWSNSGTLSTMAARIRMSEPHLYSGLLVASGWLGGVVLAVLFVQVSGKPLTLGQYALSVLMLLAYAWYAARVRYDASGTSTRRKVATLGPLLVLFALTYGVMSVRAASAAVLVGLEAGTLLAAGLVLVVHNKIGRDHAAPGVSSSGPLDMVRRTG